MRREFLPLLRIDPRFLGYPVLSLVTVCLMPSCIPIEYSRFYLNNHGSVHRNNILVYNSNELHKSQRLLYLTTALHVSGVTITHLQEHKTTVTTTSGNRYTVLLSAAIVEDN